MTDSVSLQWVGDLRFEAKSGDQAVSVDGDHRTGTSPVRLLLESVGSCAAIDVVDILRKGRQEVTALHLEVRADRRPDPPRFVKKLYLAFRIEGVVDEKKAQRAVDLSLEKYCSVFHSLRKDMHVEVEVEVVGS